MCVFICVFYVSLCLCVCLSLGEPDTFECASDDDCSNHGICYAKVCYCDRGFLGTDCSTESKKQVCHTYLYTLDTFDGNLIRTLSLKEIYTFQ